MKAELKKTLIGMAAGAFGIAMIGCGGDVEAVEEDTDGTETAGGEASCSGEASYSGESETEVDKEVDVEAETEAEGGEASCGAGSCGGK